MESLVPRICKGKITRSFMATAPRFICVTRLSSVEDSIMEVPDTLIIAGNIQNRVKFQFPNGREIHVQYEPSIRCFTNLQALRNELGRDDRFYLLFSCKGTGIFSVEVFEVFNNEMTEIEYATNHMIPRAPATYQDTQGGVQWKFIDRAIGPIFRVGSAYVSQQFMERFGSQIPYWITISLVNGEQYNCRFRHDQRKIFGLRALVKKYVEPWEFLLFTYRGRGNFGLSIFDKSWIEKSLLQVDLKEGVSCIDEYEGEDEKSIGASTNKNNELRTILKEFMTALTWSNINGSTHGVYIPARVKPLGRGWIAGEQVTLKTEKGSWKVGLVMSNGVPRFSRGWNKFCDDNELLQNQKIKFGLEEGNNGLVFNVK